MLIWQIAVLLGVSNETRPDSAADDAQSRNLARVRHARGQGPKPEARPVDPATLAAFSQGRVA